MKLINAFYLTVALLIGGACYKTLEPILAKNGTTVISAVTENGERPISVKLPDNLTKRQFELLNFAYEVAKADGFKEPKYLQGIIMQESKAGSMNSFRVAGLTNAPGNRYFGIGQVKLVAAKAVMQRYPEMWKHLDTRTDEELQARLIVDDHFNIRIASKYAIIMGINSNPAKAITSYNLGPGGAQDVDPSAHHYTVKVKQYSDKLKNVGTKSVEIQSSKPTQLTYLASRR